MNADLEDEIARRPCFVQALDFAAHLEGGAHRRSSVGLNCNVLRFLSIEPISCVSKCVAADGKIHERICARPIRFGAARQ